MKRTLVAFFLIVLSFASITSWSATIPLAHGVPAAAGSEDCFAKSFGKPVGEVASSEARSVQQTSDGGYIVAGWTEGFGAGIYDLWILKLNSDGTVQWQNTYGGAAGDTAFSVQQTSDGGYIVAGDTASFGAVSTDFWVLKLDPDGIVQWQKAYGGIGGSGGDTAYSIQQTSDGGYIVTGFFSGGLNRDLWVMKLDSTGGIEWQEGMGDQFNYAEETAYSVQQTSDGGYVLAGYSTLGSGGRDFWVVKLDSTGHVQWQKAYGGAADDTAYSIQQTSDGGYVVAGGTSSFGSGNIDFWVLKLDSSGGVLWQEAYGGVGVDVAYSIKETEEGGYVVAGRTNYFGAGMDDVWVLKLDPDGIVQLQKTYGGIGDDVAYSVEQTKNGGYVFAGVRDATAFAWHSHGRLWVLKVDSEGTIPGSCPLGVTSSGNTSPSTATVVDTADPSYEIAVAVTSTNAVGLPAVDFEILVQCVGVNPQMSVLADLWRERFARTDLDSVAYDASLAGAYRWDLDMMSVDPTYPAIGSPQTSITTQHGPDHFYFEPVPTATSGSYQYGWSFPNIESGGYGAETYIESDLPVTFSPGFDSDRIISPLLLSSGQVTQTVTVHVTPHDGYQKLIVTVSADATDLTSAALVPASPAVTPVPAGGCKFDSGPEYFTWNCGGAEVGRTYAFSADFVVNNNVYPTIVEHKPRVVVRGQHILDDESDLSRGSSLTVTDDVLGDMTYSADGQYSWNYLARDRWTVIYRPLASPTVTLTVNVVGSGSVTKTPDQLTYSYNDVVTLTATADLGWAFAGWSGDLSGSANPATITITGDKAVTATFIGPNTIKQRVLQELTDLRAAVTDKHDGKKLDQAIDHLSKSLQPDLWVSETQLDPKRGDKVFQEEKDAVVKLLELIKDKKSTLSAGQLTMLQSFIDRLVKADQLLARAAISDAAGGKPKQLNQANNELAKGDELVTAGKYVDAMEQYRNAWNHAIIAL